VLTCEELAKRIVALSSLDGLRGMTGLRHVRAKAKKQNENLTYQ
jgi:hypothetical protein